jgi:hypothetical protein
MLLRFFKKSYFAQLLILLLITIVWWAPLTAEPVAPGFLPLPLWLRKTAAILLFFTTALIVNAASCQHRISGRNSYLTAFFFLLSGSATGFLTQMSPYLPATFFFALFYMKVFDLQNSTHIIITVFDAGLFLGIASLFYPPAALLLLFLWLALIVYQVGQWRAYITAFTGMILPWVFLATGYFWEDKLPKIVPYLLHYFHLRTDFPLFSYKLDGILFLFIALTTLFAFFSLLGKRSTFNISLRQHIAVNLWGLAFTFLLWVLFANPLWSLILCALPAALVQAAYFSRLQKLKWANLWIWVWILLIFANHFLPTAYVA